MRREPSSAPAGRVERVARGIAPLPPPRGVSPLRMRLLRLCLTPEGAPCPDKLDALRRVTLREALELERVAHHRQREAGHLQDALEEDARRNADNGRDPARPRRR